MKKLELVTQWARESGVSRAEAADRLDGVVCHILSQLRLGQEAPLPGVGKLSLRANGKLRFKPARTAR